LYLSHCPALQCTPMSRIAMHTMIASSTCAPARGPSLLVIQCSVPILECANQGGILIRKYSALYLGWLILCFRWYKVYNSTALTAAPWSCHAQPQLLPLLAAANGQPEGRSASAQTLLLAGAAAAAPVVLDTDGQWSAVEHQTAATASSKLHWQHGVGLRSAAQEVRYDCSCYSPVRILTVMGRSTCAAMPATILASLVGFLSSAAPRPLLVASAVQGACVHRDCWRCIGLADGAANTVSGSAFSSAPGCWCGWCGHPIM
jgi:hypothetical protein